MKSYRVLRKEAWDFYSQIGSVICPALNNERIVFSRAGFHHLIKKGRAPRPIKDQARRFRLLKHLCETLENPDKSIVFRQESTASFWKLTKQFEDKVISVIIRQKGGSPKHFFSIMDKKIN